MARGALRLPGAGDRARGRGPGNRTPFYSATHAGGRVLRPHAGAGRGMSGAATVQGIVVRDLIRTTRQRSRLVAGLARPFIWVFLIGAGFNSIARIEGGLSYQAFAYPGGIVMAALFGGMLTAISTVYDREFGMLRLMLASPSGVGAVLCGRTLSAAIIGGAQGAIVLACAPLAVH